MGKGKTETKVGEKTKIEAKKGVKVGEMAKKRG